MKILLNTFHLNGHALKFHKSLNYLVHVGKNRGRIQMLGWKRTYVFHSFFDHARGYWRLTLTQREGMEPI